MTITTEQIDKRTAYLAVQGEIDLYSSGKLRSGFTSLLAAGCSQVIVDLQSLEYIDSSGVGVLIYMLQSLKKCHGTLMVTGLHGSPERVLTMSNIISLLNIYPNRQEAMQALQIPPAAAEHNAPHQEDTSCSFPKS
ncbi:MAG: STAS domain-containing protein [Spirochaeta sp.]